MMPDDTTSLSPSLSPHMSTGANQTAAPDASSPYANAPHYANAPQSSSPQSGAGQKCDGGVGDGHSPDACLQPPVSRPARISGRTLAIGAPSPVRLMMDHA
jgi:hypothetical protein